jgi:OOP family OmpA-OmpF porin
MMNTTRRRAKAAAIAFLLVLAGTPGAALLPDLPLPQGAVLTFADTTADGRYALPIGPWQPQTGIPTAVIEGSVTARTWESRAGLTPQQVVRPLRDVLVAEGWEVVLDCAAAECGGFDFRFATRVIPAPAMFVDIGRYRFVSLMGPDGAAVSLLASGDTAASYLQIIHAARTPLPTAPTARPIDGTAPSAPDAAPLSGDLIATLEADGHVVLPDLVFASGAASLAPGQIASLDALAGYLRQNPDRRILFVGHTDARGTLEANQALSRRRAEAAVTYLRETHGLQDGRIGAEGAGFLAPIASNLTEAGRQANRRIDAVLLPRD